MHRPWGGLYPFTGRTPTLNGQALEEIVLASARVLAALHQQMARQTVGDEALCEAPFALMLPKNRSAYSQFYPLPEAHSDHVIGGASCAGDVAQHPRRGRGPPLSDLALA